ncbi:MAG: STAS domain-containing protein [Bacteriovoracia bacterium]
MKKAGDTVVVEVQGTIDFEAQAPLRDHLERLVDSTKSDSIPKKIIFDFSDLNFVGSSGIYSFIQTLKDINHRADQSTGIRPRYCNVKSEFQRLIKAFDEQNSFEFFENSDRARKSFDN